MGDKGKRCDLGRLQAVAHRDLEPRARCRVTRIDNRRLARVAKLAGAPRDPAAGLILHVRLGEVVEPGQPLFTVHAQAAGELAYALTYASAQGEIIAVEESR